MSAFDVSVDSMAAFFIKKKQLLYFYPKFYPICMLKMICRTQSINQWITPVSHVIPAKQPQPPSNPLHSPSPPPSPTFPSTTCLRTSRATGYFSYDPGFTCTGSCLSAITFIDGPKEWSPVTGEMDRGVVKGGGGGGRSKQLKKDEVDTNTLLTGNPTQPLKKIWYCI